MQKRFERIYIEISNVCNLTCSFCPEVDRPKNFMDEDFFKRVIHEAGPLTKSVCFHVMGEPLLHPKFSEYINICEKASMPVQITSNGVLLNEARENALLNPTVRQVNFSLQSFESNFPEKDPTQYLEKIFGFTERAFVERPDLYINYRIWNLPKANGKTMSTQATKKTEDVFSRIEKRFGVEIKDQVDVGFKKGVHLKNRLSLHFDTRFDWPSPELPVRGSTGFCHGLGNHIAILTEGTVVPCCLDKEGRLELGNCKKTTLDEILKAERARNMKTGFDRGELVEDLCKRCTFISRFDGKARKLSQQLKRSVNASDVVVG